MHCQNLQWWTIAITPYKRNLYKINFVKVHEAEAANLV